MYGQKKGECGLYIWRKQEKKGVEKGRKKTSANLWIPFSGISIFCLNYKVNIVFLSCYLGSKILVMNGSWCFIVLQMMELHFGFH